MFGIGSKDIAIDLGTANTLVFLKGKGIVVQEPSVVAMEKKSHKIIAVGNEARKMIGRTPANIEVIRPMRDGVIADFETTTIMLKHFIEQAYKKSYFSSKPRLMVAVPSGITEVEKRVVIDAALQAGAKEAYTIEESFAAAVGAKLPVLEPTGSMVVDIGGGTTEVAIISLGGIVVSETIKVAGDKMDQALINYIRKNHNLMIGNPTAEKLKEENGIVVENVGEKMIHELKGRDLLTGLPRKIEIRTEEITEALGEITKLIISAIRSTLEKAPPELAADIIDRGITLTGGGSLLHNLDKVLNEESQITIHIADNPFECVAIGTGRAIDNIDMYKRHGIFTK